jgi:hypothetical protein
LVLLIGALTGAAQADNCSTTTVNLLIGQTCVLGGVAFNFTSFSTGSPGDPTSGGLDPAQLGFTPTASGFSLTNAGGGAFTVNAPANEEAGYFFNLFYTMHTVNGMNTIVRVGADGAGMSSGYDPSADFSYGFALTDAYGYNFSQGDSSFGSQLNTVSTFGPVVFFDGAAFQNLQQATEFGYSQIYLDAYNGGSASIASSNTSFRPQSVPEPATFWLLAPGALAALRRLSRKTRV